MTTAQIHHRSFAGKRPETDDQLATLPQESQAALRQFSLERNVAYGVDPADAVELRSRVMAGEAWEDAAQALAETCLALVGDDAHAATKVHYRRRASALVRMSQMMHLEDTPRRRAIFARAADLYAAAADIAGDRERVSIDTPCGTIVGWLISGGPAPVGAVVVIGGIEGWAMDFDVLGEALAARDLDVLLLDGPGQGESRFAHGTYLKPDWAAAYAAALDLLETRSPHLPLGIIGNSMGGSFAMAVAVSDPRIRACCNNGGIVYPGMVPPSIGTFFLKMKTFCDVTDDQDATEIWSTVAPVGDGPNSGYPLLVVHGGADPMISDDLAQMMFDGAPTTDKSMTVFSDGDHCIYNHRHDRDALIADWMHDRLLAAKEV